MFLSRQVSVSLCGIAVWVLACTDTNAVAQPAGGSTGSMTPEQKIELAIRKIDVPDLKEAERLIREAEIEKPTLLTLKLARGLYFVATKQGASALAELESYNSNAHGDWRGLAAIGELYVQSRMYSSARLPLERAVPLAPAKENGKPVKSKVLINLASTYLGLVKNKEAVSTAKEAQAIAADDAEIQLRVGEIAMQAQDFTLALAAIDQAVLLFKNDIRDDPFNRTAHEKLRMAYRGATMLYDRQRVADAENAEPYYRVARISLQAAEIERRIAMLDALQFVSQAIERSPKNNDMKLFLIELEYSLGGSKDASTMIDAILTGDEKNEKALEWKTKFASEPPRLVLP